MRQRRVAARVAVIDPDDSIFLFRYQDGEVGRHWAMPGGGLEVGESPLQAARRELAEETGWIDLEPGPLLWTWQHNFIHFGVPVTQHEQVYLARSIRRDPEGDLRQAHLLDEILEWRWWSAAQLASTAEAMWPPQLFDLLTRLRTHGPPEHPTDLGHS